MSARGIRASLEAQCAAHTDRQKVRGPGSRRRHDRLLHPRRAQLLAVPELAAGQVDLDAGGKPVPRVPLESLAVADDVRNQDLPAQQLADDEGGGGALVAGSVVRRPRVGILRGLRAPAAADRVLELAEAE